ncbi:hypothetical protein ACFSDD_11065 [Salipiger marinus]|uniref:hypothetical protein n=1 Tax=Salipiger marinus TaxID=555512 RepID=UPI002B6356E4|nr:hypothetical protein [Salipiger manganoxidans]MEB3419911.1 hypothetical protein [Salipiger manganoxidans]
MSRIPTAEIVVNGRRKIVNADDPRAQAVPERKAPEDRAAIATMPKGEVREWLEELNIEVAKGATVEEMRAALTGAMFPDA